MCEYTGTHTHTHSHTHTHADAQRHTIQKHKDKTSTDGPHKPTHAQSNDKILSVYVSDQLCYKLCMLCIVALKAGNKTRHCTGVESANGKRG